MPRRLPFIETFLIYESCHFLSFSLSLLEAARPHVGQRKHILIYWVSIDYIRQLSPAFAISALAFFGPSIISQRSYTFSNISAYENCWLIMREVHYGHIDEAAFWCCCRFALAISFRLRWIDFVHFLFRAAGHILGKPILFGYWPCTYYHSLPAPPRRQSSECLDLSLIIAFAFQHIAERFRLHYTMMMWWIFLYCRHAGYFRYQPPAYDRAPLLSAKPHFARAARP